MKAQKYIALLAAVLMLSAAGGRILAQTEEQIEQFNAERERYFNEQLELSEAEKEAFWPVYNDFNNRKMKLMEEERNTYRYARQNEGNLSKEEMKTTMDQILELKSRIMDLDLQYYGSTFPELLGAEKTLELYMAEWEFRRHLIGKLRGRDGRPGRGEGRGQGRRY